MTGLNEIQSTQPQAVFSVEFKSNLNGLNYIYGSFWDEDSALRVVGYRKGGRWVSLPFTVSYGSFAKDIDLFGDTLLIGGYFGNIRLDNDTSKRFPPSSLLKWHQDSLWVDSTIAGVYDIDIRGDSILIWGDYCIDSLGQPILNQFLSSDGGKSWTYPYSVIHPTESTPFFGAYPKIAIKGQNIYTLNDQSPPGNPYNGIVKWNGSQWIAFGNGLQGLNSKVYDFEFFQGDLIIGGAFSKKMNPGDPGNFIARWDGIQWNEFGTGFNNEAWDLYVHDSLLFCLQWGTKFGDVTLPYLGAWDGRQWCGTNLGIFNHRPEAFGFANDTLFLSFKSNPIVLNNDTLPMVIYFDGDYLSNPYSICSTPNLIIEEKSLSPVFLYPNPTSGVVRIKGVLEEEIQKVEVFDLMGRKVLKCNKCIELNFSSFQPGLYVIRISNMKELVQRKVEVIP
ncbi:MAG: T9SS type A sorting domain-containing protein [Bacteroidota bacterium]|nr:T9SS type A sorting domain-containing protein [Bacteroidota bacterium]MDX5427368.1 T9SS type A sorting domain-containing protein [Bacteroidota bacterium]MDX5447409.1 T9SS type A sorting domain-containing protein [Bacteroidota bacterium]MDX5505316.1 T9SS type A sorting domain-containing protein [Bacteroidota bacterium]